MTKFFDLGLAEPILQAIIAQGYEHPTPIQAQAIPVLLNGQDVIGIAQTGTGKTASFVLPLLHQIATQKKRSMPKMCSALILSPTRELAAQIVANIENYSVHTKIKTALIVGGVRPASQLKALDGGVDIVVATPGRLLDHIETGAIILHRTSALVIDEADQMLDLGFLPSIRKIVERLPVRRQTALLSATMPGQIRKLADDLLNAPAEITVATVSKPVERIKQSVRHVKTSDKHSVLIDILSEKAVERTVVFTRTKRGADRVCKHLVAAQLNASSIHGDKSQSQRDRAMDDFRSGKTTILVATDVAARGIDIDNISHVVNFELPNVPEAYVHRIGRTARAGKSGIAISLCDTSEKGLLNDIERLIGAKLSSASSESSKSTQEFAGIQRPAKISEKQIALKPMRAKTVPQDRFKRSHIGASAEGVTDGLMRMLSNVGNHTKSAA